MYGFLKKKKKKYKLLLKIIFTVLKRRDSLQTPGGGLMSRWQEFREVAVGVRLFGEAAQSGLHGGEPDTETQDAHIFEKQLTPKRQKSQVL